MLQVLEVSIMYEIADLAESPDVEYPAMPPKHSSQSQHNQTSNVARCTASYASLNYNGKVGHRQHRHHHHWSECNNKYYL